MGALNEGAPFATAFTFAAPDKGGTGRSVLSANLAYQRALLGDQVAYVDFDFGSPTDAAVLDVPSALLGDEEQGLHSYLEGEDTEPAGIDVWRQTEHPVLRARQNQAGQLVLYPGDAGGGEFAVHEEVLERCTDLLLRLNSEFDLVMVDLSAGRSYAVDLALAATAQPRMRHVARRWLVFHHWTRQHVIAAAGLVHKENGILHSGVDRGHDEGTLRGNIRFVRAAAPDLESAVWAQGFARPTGMDAVLQRCAPPACLRPAHRRQRSARHRAAGANPVVAGAADHRGRRLRDGDRK